MSAERSEIRMLGRFPQLTGDEVNSISRQLAEMMEKIASLNARILLSSASDKSTPAELSGNIGDFFDGLECPSELDRTQSKTNGLVPFHENADKNTSIRYINAGNEFIQTVREMDALSQWEVSVLFPNAFIDHFSDHGEIYSHLPNHRRRVRVVYESDDTGIMLRERSMQIRGTEEGWLTRALPEISAAAMLFDRRNLLLPVHLLNPNSGALLVDVSVIVNVISGIFDDLWSAAGDASGELRNNIDGEDRRIMELLAAGVTDDVVARQLGVSERTVRRKVATIMLRLRASSRFQAGLHAARHNLI